MPSSTTHSHILYSGGKKARHLVGSNLILPKGWWEKPELDGFFENQKSRGLPDFR